MWTDGSLRLSTTADDIGKFACFPILAPIPSSLTRNGSDDHLKSAAREIFMYRFCLAGLVLGIFLSGSLGCGSGSPKQEQKDPFKARQQAAPKEKQGGFMKP
jgi:hypothetical protein